MGLRSEIDEEFERREREEKRKKKARKFVDKILDNLDTDIGFTEQQRLLDKLGLNEEDGGMHFRKW